MAPTLIEALGRVWVFQGLSEDELAHLCGLAHTRQYKARETIVEKGEAATEFFVLLSGRAKVAMAGADGSDAAVNVMGPGEVFGEIDLDGQPRSATVTTLEECEMAVSIGRHSTIYSFRRRPLRSSCWRYLREECAS